MSFSPHPANQIDLVLASASPRRQEILSLLQLPFRIQPADCDETPSLTESPTDLVRRLARTKALTVARKNPGSIILAADTVVVFQNEVIGKPDSPAEAAEILRRLRGQSHIVLTAVAVCAGVSGNCLVETTETHVWMRTYTDQEIADYVATGDPLDKAAAYAIQHQIFRPVARTEGCPASVMGLPLCIATRMIGQLDIPVPLQPTRNCNPSASTCSVAATLSL